MIPTTRVGRPDTAAIRLGIFAQLKQIALQAYDRIVGLLLTDIAVDGAITKAPGGGEVAGLVMNPDAKVKMRGVVVGKVGSIEERPDGKAVLNLEMQPSQMHLIPSNVRVDIASPTVFGANSVELVRPADSSPQPLKAGSVLQNKGSRRDRHR